MTAQIMGTMTANEVAWTNAAAAALLAICNATEARPDAVQIGDINTLADAFHTIGMVGTHSTMFEMLHSAEDLAHFEAITSRLLNGFDFDHCEGTQRHRRSAAGEHPVPVRRNRGSIMRLEKSRGVARRWPIGRPVVGKPVMMKTIAGIPLSSNEA